MQSFVPYMQDSILQHNSGDALLWYLWARDDVGYRIGRRCPSDTCKDKGRLRMKIRKPQAMFTWKWSIKFKFVYNFQIEQESILIYWFDYIYLTGGMNNEQGNHFISDI